jgi:hypothetical protein
MTTLTMRDEKRLDVIQRVYRSELTVVEASQVLNISERPRPSFGSDQDKLLISDHKMH